MIDLTPILQALAALFCTVVTALIIPFIKSRTDCERLERIQHWIRIAVGAAEQIYQDPKSGVEKKAYVHRSISAHGFHVDAATLNALIESSVYTLKGDACE
ncbi:MAG: phage holin family protein [Oscillospiraceae bacterium]|nr:phage holin family protein [Oscillospiraceae bacterium]